MQLVAIVKIRSCLLLVKVEPQGVSFFQAIPYQATDAIYCETKIAEKVKELKSSHYGLSWTYDVVKANANSRLSGFCQKSYRVRGLQNQMKTNCLKKQQNWAGNDPD